MKKFLTLVSVLVLSLALLCACGGAAPSGSPPLPDSPAPSDGAAPSDSAVPSPSSAVDADLDQPVFEFASGLSNSDVSLTVNGASIPMETFCYWLGNYCYYIDSNYAMYGMAADFTDQAMADALVEYAQNVLTYYAVVRQLCAENHVVLTQSQADEIQHNIDSTLADTGLTMEQLLWNFGLTEDSFRYINESSYLRSGLLDRLAGEPTQDDLEQYAADAGAYRCKHILLKTVSEDQINGDGSVTTAEEYNGERRAQMEDFLTQLRAASSLEPAFDLLMNAYSEDGRTADGALAAPDGYTTRKGEMVSEFEQAALALEPGGLSDIVETAYGYHVILRLPLDVSQYREEWQDETLEAIIAAEMEKAEVVPAEALGGIDVADFYQRYTAWQDAFTKQYGKQG